jgi:hypothetical protein
MKSEFNRYLEIDLGSQSWSVFCLPDDVLARYVGGKGVPKPETLEALGVEYPRDG